MAKARKPRKSAKARKPTRNLVARARRLAFRAVLAVCAFALLLVLLFSVVNPPTTHTIWSETRRLGDVRQSWTRIEDMASVMPRAAVAAEDANFCLHWGFDVGAIRAAIDQGAVRGASTISQQVVKNVFLWQGRSWIRKAFETALTPVVELIWSKRRIVEVYLNVAEMDEGVFGVGAAARHYFGVAPADLTARQAALLAAVLPSPKTRSAANPSAKVQRRARRIVDGAATIRADGRAECFED